MCNAAKFGLPGPDCRRLTAVAASPPAAARPSHTGPHRCSRGYRWRGLNPSCVHTATVCCAARPPHHSPQPHRSKAGPLAMTHPAAYRRPVALLLSVTAAALLCGGIAPGVQAQPPPAGSYPVNATKCRALPFPTVQFSDPALATSCVAGNATVPDICSVPCLSAWDPALVRCSNKTGVPVWEIQRNCLGGCCRAQAAGMAEDATLQHKE